MISIVLLVIGVAAVGVGLSVLVPEALRKIKR